MDMPGHQMERLCRELIVQSAEARQRSAESQHRSEKLIARSAELRARVAEIGYTLACIDRRLEHLRADVR